MNYLAQGDPDSSCRSCGHEVRSRAFFCDRCGQIHTDATGPVGKLVELHGNGTLTDQEYVAALKIQHGTFKPDVIVVPAPKTRRRWTQTRVGMEAAALSAVIVGVGGFMAGALITGYGPFKAGRNPSAVALVDHDGTRWDQANLADPAIVLADLDRFWEKTEPGLGPAAGDAVDSDNYPSGCQAKAAAHWCPGTEQLVYSSEALAALTETGGNGAAAVALVRAGAQRIGDLASIDSAVTLECLTGAAVAHLDNGSSGDALAAILTSYSWAGVKTDRSFGIAERSQAAADGYHNGTTACRKYRSAISEEMRFGGEGDSRGELRGIIEAAVSAADEAFLGVEKAKIGPDEIVAYGCGVGNAYTKACDGRIAYNPDRLATLGETHGPLAPVVAIIMAYTALQQAELGERGDPMSQYCGVGATAHFIQEANASYGSELATIIVPHLDPILSMLIAEAGSGEKALDIIEAVWDGYQNGAGTCL